MMATGGFSKESLHYWRSGILLLNVGAPVLRKLLEQKAELDAGTGTSINEFLRVGENKKKLRRLDSRTLPRALYEKVYPPGGRTNLETWDITLLCTVLKELFILTPNERGLVDSIRKIRNDNFAHNPSASLDDVEFDRIWKEISTTIYGLLDLINDQEFTISMKERIQLYKEKELQKSEIDEAKNALETKWKEDIQKHLISQYQNYNAILPVAPLYDDEGIQISELYTNVNLCEDTRIKGQHSLADEGNQISSYEELFERKTTRESVKQIILRGPAGRGKSSYCIRIANVWASAVRKRSEDPTIPLTDDEKEMLKFDFVFLVAMRFSVGIDSAFDMVKGQLFEEAPTYGDNLERCFGEGRCLLILDGLDEWKSASGSPLPKWDRLYSCSRIISTRPWKLNSIPARMDFRVIDIGIMDESAIRTLATKILANYYGVSITNQERDVNNFMRALKKQSLDSLAEIPLILTYLICVWKDENGLEESKTVNYGGLLECLIRYSNTTYESAVKRRKLPGALSFRGNCQKYSDILYKVAKLAYTSMIGHDQPILVFGRQEVLEYFKDKDEFQFCLDTGLLSQSKARGAKAKDNTIIQFFHKSVQEFLVAFHIATSGELHKLQEQLSTVDKILATSVVLVFICGLRPEFCNNITKMVAKVSNSSSEIQKFRSSLDGRFTFRKGNSLSSYRWVKDIQGLVLQCRHECSYNKRFAGAVRTNVQSHHGVVFPAGAWMVKSALHDFIVKENTRDDIMSMMEGNIKHVKSVYVDFPPRQISLQLSSLIQKSGHLSRLHLDQMSSGLIYDIKPKTLKNLQSLSLALDNVSQFPSNMGHLTNLKALSLNISANHQVIEEFVRYLQSCSKLEEIELENVKCTTKHGHQSCNMILDLTENKCLKRLSVQDISISEVVLDRSVDLEYAWLSGRMHNPSSVVEFFPTSKSLTTLILGDLFAFNCFRWMANDVFLISDVLPKLENLTHLHLLGIAFGDNVLRLPNPARNLDTVSVEDVILSDRNWTLFLRSLADITDRPVSAMITTKEDAYPIQLISQASQRHFRNVDISLGGNRCVVKFETIPRHSGAQQLEIIYERSASTERMNGDEEIGTCECNLHKDVIEIWDGVESETI